MFTAYIQPHCQAIVTAAPNLNYCWEENTSDPIKQVERGKAVYIEDLGLDGNRPSREMRRNVLTNIFGGVLIMIPRAIQNKHRDQ